MIPAVLGLAVLVFAPSAPAAPGGAAAGLDLLGLEASSPGASLPAGWELRRVRGRAAPKFSVRCQESPVLDVRGQGAAAFAYRRLSEPLAPGSGWLRWSWRSAELPRSADLRDASRDDSALRVYVVFGRPSLLGSGRAIFYSWGNREPEALSRAAFESDRIAVVRVAGAREADGRWRSQAVDPFADYARFWGGEPPPITAIGVGQDTDGTGEPAAAELRELTWLAATR